MEGNIIRFETKEYEKFYQEISSIFDKIKKSIISLDGTYKTEVIQSKSNPNKYSIPYFKKRKATQDTREIDNDYFAGVALTGLDVFFLCEKLQRIKEIEKYSGQKIGLDDLGYLLLFNPETEEIEISLTFEKRN
jgi:hypothetical protein